MMRPSARLAAAASVKRWDRLRSLSCIAASAATTGGHDAVSGGGRSRPRVNFCCSSRSFHGTRATLVRDYYQVLGVAKSSTAGEIKKAYYALAKKLHPDTNRGDANAESKFQEVQKAYDTLKDDEKRTIYDQVGPESYEKIANGEGTGTNDKPFDETIYNVRNAEDLFSFFTNKRRQFGGQDVQVTLELSFMEAIQGCTKAIKYRNYILCDSCGGTGLPLGSKPEKCKTCGGAGSVDMQVGNLRVQYTCEKCGGLGKFVKETCPSCTGLKILNRLKSHKLDVMAGVDDKETIKVKGAGGADPDGGQPGDLFVTFKVRTDPVFRREKNNIHADAILNITQDVIGWREEWRARRRSWAGRVERGGMMIDTMVIVD